MPKITFTFNKEKDLWNNWDTVNYTSPWNKNQKFNKNSNIEKICKDKTFEECKDELEKNMQKIHKSVLINETQKSFQNAWNKINDEFFERLEKITKHKFPFEEITAFITTQGRCPYNPKEATFFVSMFSGIPNALKTIAHELMHIDLHNNEWKQIEKELGREKTADLKEALTVLLNLEFKDLWFVSDKGKDSIEQQNLREFITKEWEKQKDYKLLLNACTNHLK